MARSRAKANPKTAPAPSLPATATVSAPTIHTEQPSPSEWRSRCPGIGILFGIVFGIVPVLGSWLSAHWSPTVVWRCFDRINEWRYDAGLWPAVEMMAGECAFSDSIPLVSATLQYGKTLPEVYRYYEKETAQHRLMLQTAKLPGVHAFYAGAGMGKSTVAPAVLQELYSQGVPAAFVVFDAPGELKRQVATSLQTTSDKLSDDLTGALVKLQKRGFHEVVLVIDAIDEHDLTEMDTETIKVLAKVSWISRLFEFPVYFSVICLARTLETKQRFEKMNGGHKITGGIATEPCPPVSASTLQSYASQLQVANKDYRKWTDKAPYLIVVTHFAESKWNMSKVVEHFEAVCYTGTTSPTQNKAVWARQLQKKDGAGGLELAGNAFKITGQVSDIDDLKEAIKRKNPQTVLCDAFQIDIYLQQEDGGWTMQTRMSASLRETDEDDVYGYVLP